MQDVIGTSPDSFRLLRTACIYQRAESLVGIFQGHPYSKFHWVVVIVVAMSWLPTAFTYEIT